MSCFSQAGGLHPDTPCPSYPPTPPPRGGQHGSPLPRGGFRVLRTLNLKAGMGQGDGGGLSSSEGTGGHRSCPQPTHLRRRPQCQRLRASPARGRGDAQRGCRARRRTTDHDGCSFSLIPPSHPWGRQDEASRRAPTRWRGGGGGTVPVVCHPLGSPSPTRDSCLASPVPATSSKYLDVIKSSPPGPKA